MADITNRALREGDVIDLDAVQVGDVLEVELAGGDVYRMVVEAKDGNELVLRRAPLAGARSLWEPHVAPV